MADVVPYRGPLGPIPGAPLAQDCHGLSAMLPKLVHLGLNGTYLVRELRVFPKEVLQRHFRTLVG
eukprot:7243070-Alexandrium_andersonii.AAC.1